MSKWYSAFTKKIREEKSLSYRLEFELPGLPTGMNNISGKYAWQKTKEKNKWHNAVFQITLGKRPETPLKRAKISCIRYSSVAPDFEGLVTSFKHIIDGLIVAGVIEDDSMQHIGKPSYDWVKCKPKEGKISVIVESINE